MTEPDFILPMALADSKPWWQSQTIRAALAVILAQLAALAGYAIDGSTLLDLMTSLAGVAGGALAIWGRVVAEQPIRR